MRVESSIKNLSVAMVGQFAGLIVSFFARTVFLKYLNEEYLGLNGLFTNILTILSLVELGIGPAMSFSMYKPLAENDISKIKSLMSIYKKSYIIIGVAILILGIVLTPFYPILLNEIPNIKNLNTIYILFVLNSAISYFYSYKRSLIICDQKRYIATIFRYGFYIVLNIIQILVLILSHNYILFLVCQTIFTWAENICISKTADKIYPYLKQNDIEKLDTDSIVEIKKNISAMLFHKIGGIVVNSTDNIIISKFVGLKAVGLYSNYYIIITALNSIFNQLFTSIVASVGNLGVSESKEKIVQVFNRVFFLNFWIFGFASICLLILFNPFIELWIGKDYLFSNTVVITIVLNFYITGMRKSANTFKEATGAFWNDRYKPIFEVIINLIASIILAKDFGINGVLVGTIISTVTVCFWVEPYVLYKYIFKTNFADYFKRYIIYTAVGILATLITYYICSFILFEGWISLFIKLLVCIVIPNFILILFFFRTNEFKYYIDLTLKLIRNIKKL